VTKQFPVYPEVDILKKPLDQYPIIHVQAVIEQVEESKHGHQHLLINQIQILDIENGDPSTVTDEIFVAIRYGDGNGLPEPIPGLEAGQPIELQGVYIPADEAYPSEDNPGDPVIHFTHHPLGFVIYQGKLYK
jgi:hypothetical protein